MRALADPQFVSVEEYLHTSYEFECEYVDGVLEQRHLGELQHSVMQGFFSFLFRKNESGWNVRTMLSYSIQVSPTRFRVPDVTVLRADTPRQPILRTPPLLVIEIVSAVDTFSRLSRKVIDYVTFGVEHIWIIDPYERRAYLADDHGFHEPSEGSSTATLTIAGTPIVVPLAEVWQELDPH